MARMGLNALLLLGLLGTALVYPVFACDPDLTMDLGINSTSAADFTFTGFRNPATLGVGAASATPAGVPGLTGLGLAAVYFEFGTFSQIDPHIHPRGTEIFYVTSGTITVGFVDTADDLFPIVSQIGDFFVFPKGTLHYQRNNADAPASGYSVLSSENPGTLFVASALFNATDGGIPDNVLTSALKTDEATVTAIKAAFAS